MRVSGVTKTKCYPKIIDGKENTENIKCVETEFIVSPDVRAKILLSCHELKTMGILVKDFPTAKTIEGKTETCHCNKKLTGKHKENRNREDQIDTNEEEFNEEYGENEMTEEQLQKAFIKHKAEERLQELYNMSYEQEKEMIDYE